MAKKRANNKKENSLGFQLKWGYKGLQISFLLLIILVVLFFIIGLVIKGDISELNKTIFKAPEGSDYLGIFAGAILFIAVPFLIGIKMGMNVKKK
jgi:hypothetical protein